MQLVTSELLTLLSVGAAQLLAVISPGPSFLVTARTAVAHSRREGVKVALGLGAGTVVWSSAALLGLNVLFHAVPVLFIVMRLAGALFLVWIAWQILAHARAPLDLDRGEHGTGGKAFWRGFLVQISNPKVVVFFGSIFIALLPAQVPVWTVVSLIALVTFNEVWWYSVVALFFGAGPVRRSYLRSKTWTDRVTGAVLGVLGLRLLWAVWQES